MGLATLREESKGLLDTLWTRPWKALLHWGIGRDEFSSTVSNRVLAVTDKN
jgi:hypothetical protein